MTPPLTACVRASKSLLTKIFLLPSASPRATDCSLTQQTGIKREDKPSSKNKPCLVWMAKTHKISALFRTNSEEIFQNVLNTWNTNTESLFIWCFLKHSYVIYNTKKHQNSLWIINFKKKILSRILLLCTLYRIINLPWRFFCCLQHFQSGCF